MPEMWTENDEIVEREYENMFCGKCGEQINDGAMFCGNCGAPVNSGSNNKTEYSNSNRKSNKLLPIVIVIVLCIVAIFVYNQKFAYKKVVRQYISSVEKLNVKKALKCMPDDVLKAMEEELGDGDETLEEFLDDLQDEMDESLSSVDDYSVQADMTDVEKCDQDEIDEVESMYKSEGIRLEISKMKSVTLNIEVTASYNGDENTQNDDMLIKVGKIGSKWYIVDSDGSLFGFGL